MSTQPEELVDPRDAFLARGALPVAAAETAAISGVSVLIGAAVVSGFILVRRELAKEHPKTPQEAKKVANHAWQKILPNWLKIAVPAVTQAYALGQTGNLNYAELEILAKDYADELGEYVNQTSADALMEGFAAQVNSGWNDSLAWERAKEAYGLDSRQMRSYISGLMAQDPKSYITDPIPTASRALINQAVSVRADRIGTNEAYKASQVGKNMVWLTMAAKGDIPEGTRKKWVTAEDERVCEVCGPLDGRILPLHWKFKANTGEKFYAPGVHPNCRCRLEIVYPELGDDIVKAMPGDPYDRDRSGRFATTEQRSPMDVLRERRPTTKTDPTNPLSVLREPRSEAINIVGSNPVARGGALDVLRASKQTASPMAVLAEAKAKEDEKSSASESKQKPKTKLEPKKEDIPAVADTEDKTVVAYADLVFQSRGIDPSSLRVGQLIELDSINGYHSDKLGARLDNAIDEANGWANILRRDAAQGYGYEGDSTPSGELQPVLVKVEGVDFEEPTKSAPWTKQWDARIPSGKYVVTDITEHKLHPDVLSTDDSDLFTSVKIILLRQA